MATKSVTTKRLKTEATVVAGVREPAKGNLFDFLPAPEDLARYEKVVPGGAERILEMAEKQSSHLHTMEEQAITAEVRGARIKQALTFILALATGILGGVLLINGSELAGLIVILVDAAAVVGIAIYGGKPVEK